MLPFSLLTCRVEENKYFRTGSKFHVDEYLGCGGLILQMIYEIFYLLIIFSSLLSGEKMKVRADLYVCIA